MTATEAVDVALDIRRGNKRLADVADADRGIVRAALGNDRLLASRARSAEKHDLASRFTYAKPRAAGR